MRVNSWFRLVLAELTVNIYLVLLPLAEAIVLRYKYYNDSELVSVMRDLKEEFPDLVELFSIGKSAKGQEIWVLRISKETSRPKLSKPLVNLVDAGYLGNGAAGRLVAIFFAYSLLLAIRGYNIPFFGRELKWFGENVVMDVVPILNPDYNNDLFTTFPPDIVEGRPNPYAYGYNPIEDMYHFTSDSFNPHPRRPITGRFGSDNYVLSVWLAAGMKRLVVVKPKFPFSRHPKYAGTFDVINTNYFGDILIRNHPHISDEVDGDGEYFWRPYFSPNGEVESKSLEKGCLEFIMGISCEKFPSPYALENIVNQAIKPLTKFYRQLGSGIWVHVLCALNNTIISCASDEDCEVIGIELANLSLADEEMEKFLHDESQRRNDTIDKDGNTRPGIWDRRFNRRLIWLSPRVSPEGYFWISVLPGEYVLQAMGWFYEGNMKRLSPRVNAVVERNPEPEPTIIELLVSRKF